MDVQIDKANTSFSFEQHGIEAQDFDVSSLPILASYQSIEGRDRRVNYGSTFGVRTIRVPFKFKSHDLLDYPLFRDFIFGLVLDKEPFYIRERRRPSYQKYEFETPGQEHVVPGNYRNQFVDGKRYLVRLQTAFNLEQMLEHGEGELIFETTELPFAESVFTSTDIESNGLNYDADLYSYGMGLSYEDEKAIYSGTITPAKSLRIFNPGNIKIDPFEIPMKITIKSVQGGASGFELRNLTNGTSITFNGNVASADVIVYDGAIITKNSLQATNQAELDYIELAPGWNEIKLERGQSVHFSVDTRFYYK